ncbi:MAG TPA: M56 family metallopeptidase, partial [Chitinophagaceae bacterium]
MKSNWIDFIFSNEAIQALFWTLLHSLWQGLALAVFAALILVSTKRSGTALRYKLLVGIFMLFIISGLFTFCYEIYSVTGNTNTINKHALINIDKHVISGNYRINFIEKLIAAIQPYEKLIVFSWFIIIALKSVGMLAGLRNIYILKHRKVLDAGEYWNHQLKMLAKRAGIKRSVILLKSLIVDVPMVVGYFKPVILFPAAALTALAPEEIEAILLHELAHIRRNDFLVNILQRVTEIILFFNPAVLWVSFLIKEERENCCDDIAVQQTKNKKQFIHALLSFQERNTTSGYAPSFSGRKYYLLNRIKRIITNNNKTLNNMEKTFLVSGIVITTFAAFAFSNHKQSSTVTIPMAQPAKIAYATNDMDTVPQKLNDNESKYIMTMAGKQYKFVEVNGKVTELYVDNVKIPDNKISDYSAVIAKL